MKKSVVVAIFMVIILGCDEREHLPCFEEGGLRPSFILTDTTGAQKTIFQHGEEFDMSFSVRNTTGHTLSYTYTAPIVAFEIWQGEDLVATSVDGLAFPQVVEKGYLEPCATFIEQWRAPNSPARFSKITLEPGEYKAKVEHHGLLGLSSIESIDFSVAQ